VIAVTEKAGRVLNYFYGAVEDWAYYVAPSLDRVEPYAGRLFFAYRKNLFSGEIQILADGDSQSGAETGVYTHMQRVRAALRGLYSKQVLHGAGAR
jgi:hypothetical protein